MTNDTLNYTTDIIVNTLFSKKNEHLTLDQLKELIKPHLLKLYTESRNSGKRSVLNYLDGEIDNLFEGIKEQKNKMKNNKDKETFYVGDLVETKYGKAKVTIVDNIGKGVRVKHHITAIKTPVTDFRFSDIKK